jgi:hypothetical protein
VPGQYGPNPALHARVGRHHDGDKRNKASFPLSFETTGDLDELTGIVGGGDTGEKHRVIAGTLALAPQAADEQPNQRVGPVQRANDTRQ